MTNADGGDLLARVRRSIAYRSGPLLCKPVLAALPPGRVAPRPELPLTLLTMCGAEHMLMLEQMLFSVAAFWTRLPRVTVAADGTLSPEAVRHRFRWWPGRIEVTDWRDYQRRHRDAGRTALAAFAERDMLGRKLSAILAAAEEENTWWCDADILFYADFSGQLLDIAEQKPPYIFAAEDRVYGYDLELERAGGLSRLREIPPVNSGCVVCRGNLYDDCGLDELVQVAARRSMFLTEQTIVAAAVYRRGAVRWTRGDIRLFDDDQFTLGPTYRGRAWLARHYISPIRHLFWRDALALRMGVGRDGAAAVSR